jgi:serine/threonine protein kinase
VCSRFSSARRKRAREKARSHFGRIIGTAMAVEPGARLGPYQVERLLGSGGFGSVYRAHDSRLDRWVAIKALSEGIAGNPDRLGGFKEEARAAASLNHPHICSVYEVEHDSGVDYIVMELVDGRPLAQLTSPGGLPIHTAVRYATQIAAVMEHAHARGIVHGDVKPGNVMVTLAGDTSSSTSVSPAGCVLSTNSPSR